MVNVNKILIEFDSTIDYSKAALESEYKQLMRLFLHSNFKRKHLKIKFIHEREVYS